MKQPLRQRKHSILVKMFFSMLLSLVLMFSLLVGTIFFGGMTRQLRENAFAIFSERSAGRRDNLKGQMLQKWSNLGESVQEINRQAARILEENNATYSDFTADSPLSGELLDVVSERLFYQLRRSSATGVFLILNGSEGYSAPTAGVQQRAGVYLRDYDPGTSPADNSDLMLERAPMSFVKRHGITLDSYWEPIFTFQPGEENSYYYKPFFAACEMRGALAEDLGYWGAEDVPEGGGVPVVTYSLPLLAEDGTPYGVFGIGVTLDYLSRQLPYHEISGNVRGSYVLARGETGSDRFEKILSTGPYFKNIFGSDCQELLLSSKPVFGDSYEIFQKENKKVYGCLKELGLYNSNTPFENERWALIAVTEDDDLLGLYYSVRMFLVLTLLIAFLIGLVSVAFNSVRLSRPITQLARRVRESDPNRPVQLDKIQVAEIDELSSSIELLSRSVAESYSTLSTIMAMAGYRVGAFEYSTARPELRYTDNFFAVLHLPAPPDGCGVLSVADFKRRLEPLLRYPAEEEEKSTLYQLPVEGSEVWVRMQFVESPEKTLGVVSDVTAEILQRKRLEYERDYDSLTMLPNRRAFHAQVGARMEEGKIRIAAMVMLDLDNLKYLNDSYGHDTGDRYLQATAQVLARFAGPRALPARMSGDEFYFFLQGEERAELESLLLTIQRELGSTQLDLPDGSKTRVRISAGVAWYPKDSTDFAQLVRYADFAMYRVKHTTKGRFSNFSLENYERESFLLKNKEELNHLIEEGMVHYEFQAIVDGRDGSVFAYEALMRPSSPLFASPLDVLAMAHSQSKLYEIERLTWFKALAAFAERSPAEGREKLFVNSIPNQMLGSADLTLIENAYRGYLPRIVVELTEEEKPDGQITRAKNAVIQRWHAQIALDDFGAGYNGEVALLAVSPDFIKIDQSIVRNLDRDPNRRRLVENIMDYARRSQIAVIGEGVETRAELEALLTCGVPYLQGFYLSYPAGELAEIPEKLRREICDFHEKK